MTRSSTLLEDVSLATTRCYTQEVSPRKWLAFINQIFRRHDTAVHLDDNDCVAATLLPYILSSNPPSTQLLAYLHEALVGSSPAHIGNGLDDSLAVTTADSVVRALLSISLRESTAMRSLNCELADGVEAVCECLLSTSRLTRTSAIAIEALNGYLQACGASSDSDPSSQILAALTLLLAALLLLAAGTSSPIAADDANTATTTVLHGLLAGPVLQAIRLAGRTNIADRNTGRNLRKRPASNSDDLGQHGAEITKTVTEIREVLQLTSSRVRGSRSQQTDLQLLPIMAEVSSALSHLAESIGISFETGVEHNTERSSYEADRTLPSADALGKMGQQLTWRRSSVGSRDTFSWTAEDSPEIVVLMRLIISRELPFQTKADAAEALLRQRLFSAAKVASTDELRSEADFYYSLMAAATEIGALIASSTTLGQPAQSAACSVAWSVLCGLVPAIVDRLHHRRQPATSASADGPVALALRGLYSSHAAELTECEAASLGTSKPADDDDGMGMDLFTTDESTDRHPLRAYLLRVYEERNLVPHGLLEGVAGHEDVREDNMMLDTSLRSDAEMHKHSSSNTGSKDDILETFLAAKLREDDLSELMERCISDYAAQEVVAAQIVQLLAGKETANDQDIDTLNRFCKALSTHAVLNDILLLYVSQAELFGPMAQVLDRSDLGSLAEDDPSTLGNVVLFLQSVQLRYRLPISTFTLEPWRSTYFPAYLRSSANVTSLSQRPPDEVTLISRWITALFDSEGVSDELIRASTPQSLLILAPILVSQSLEATARGILDLDTLKSGLTYFCNPILSFTLPGVVRLLLGALRSGRQTLVGLVQPPHENAGQQGILQANLDATYLAYVLEVLAMLLTSESCPPFVHSLVLAEGFSPTSTLGNTDHVPSSGSTDAITPLEVLSRFLPLSEQGLADIKSLRAKLQGAGGPASALVGAYDAALQTHFSAVCPALLTTQLDRLLLPSTPSTALPRLTVALAREVVEPQIGNSPGAASKSLSGHQRVSSGRRPGEKHGSAMIDDTASWLGGAVSPFCAAAYLGFATLVRSLQPSEGLPWDVLGTFITHADLSFDPLSNNGNVSSAPNQMPSALRTAARFAAVVRLAVQLGFADDMKESERSVITVSKVVEQVPTSSGRREVAALLALRLARLHASVGAPPATAHQPLPLVAQALLASGAQSVGTKDADSEMHSEEVASSAGTGGASTAADTPAELVQALHVVFSHVLGGPSEARAGTEGSEGRDKDMVSDPTIV